MTLGRRTFIQMGASFAATAAAVGAAGPVRAAAIDYEGTGVEIRRSPPAEEGFRFPAEWAPHERTLMQFLPPQNWSRSQWEGAVGEWAAVANAVADFEPVTMAVRPEDRGHAEQLLGSGIELIELDLNDGWSRDSGPMILVDDTGRRCVAGFEFNGWGAKFPPYDADALAKAHFAAHLGLPLHPADLVLEGGAVTVDGEGTLITTEECLLNPNRNPGKSRDEVDAILRDWLGVSRVIWLPKGLTPDPITDGHIDGMAAFAAPGVVLLHTTDDRSDPNHAITQEAKRILEQTTDAMGRRFEVIEVPLTSWDVVHMNFYICNGAVVVPVAGNAEEDEAPLAIIDEAFPGREVVPITGRFTAEGGGGVHCITQQVPAIA